MLDRIVQSWRLRQRFWATVPPGALLRFLSAAFFTFLTFGLLTNIALGSTVPPLPRALNALFSGSVGLLFAWTAIRRPRLIPVVFVYMVGGILGVRSWMRSAVPLAPSEVEAHLAVEALAGMLSVGVSYVLFLRFIFTAARRQVELQADIALAQRIHATLVPPVDVQTEGYEAYGRSFPTTEVGGDLLDLVDGTGAVTCYVVDVSGHGVRAGTLMSMVKSAARMRLRQGGGLAEVLGDLNDVLVPLKEDGMYATCACLRLRGGTGAFALAGHLPILHYRRRAGAVFRLSTDTHLPLGLFARTPFAEGGLEVEAGDVLAVLTDGLTEVTDAQDEEFGMERLERVLLAQAQRPLPELFESILAAVRAHGPQRDDQTLLLLRRKTALV